MAIDIIVFGLTDFLISLICLVLDAVKIMLVALFAVFVLGRSIVESCDSFDNFH